MKKEFILGAKYFIKDLITENILEIQITQINEIELSFKNLSKNEDIEHYREIEQVKIVSIIDELEAMRLNNQEVFTVKTDSIKAILSREEVEKYGKTGFKDLNEIKNTVLISITEPGSDYLTENVRKQFDETLNIQFWDIEEADGQGKEPLDKEMGKKIKHFIESNKEKQFVINCEAGISRSAGVGFA